MNLNKRFKYFDTFDDLKKFKFTNVFDLSAQSLHKKILDEIKSGYDCIQLFHSTRVPDPDVFYDQGIKRMSPANLADLVAPLWPEFNSTEIVAAIWESVKDTQPDETISTFRGNTICCCAMREVFFRDQCEFLKGGSELLRVAANKLQNSIQNNEDVCNLKTRILNWTPAIVRIAVPIENICENTIHGLIDSMIIVIEEARISKKNLPVGTMCYANQTFNFYEDIPKEWIVNIEPNPKN